MKGGNRILLGLAAIALAMVYAGCSKDEDALRFGEARQAERTGTLGDARGGALRSGSSVIIDFKGFASSMMAGPSSYGENYYSASASLQVKSITNGVFTSTVNSLGGSVEFWNGGIALSKWNYYSNQGDSSLPDDWWYSYMNQMSVYNSHSQDGSNKGAGHRGDDNFGVVFGYVDSYNQQFGMNKPSFSLDRSWRLEGLWICNSSYTYGVIEHGNRFGSVGEAKKLKDINGYFKVILECYDEAGNLLGTYDHMLADYREGRPEVPALKEWTYWQIGQDGVKTVKFNFEGSDSGPYGLNTPAYVCIDDIEVR